MLPEQIQQRSIIRLAAGGTGIGQYRRGKVLVDIKAVQPGQLVIFESVIFNVINLVKCTQVFSDKFYGIFVSPENPNEKSKSADEEFVVYPTDLEKGEYYIALEPAPSDVPVSSGDASGTGTKPVAPAKADATVKEKPEVAPEETPVAKGAAKRSIKSPVKVNEDYTGTQMQRLMSELNSRGHKVVAGQDEPASAGEAPDANPTTYGEPTHETPLGHFMDALPQTTDADKVIDEVLTYLEAEHSTALGVTYKKGNYIISDVDTGNDLAEIWSDGQAVQVTALVGDSGQSVAEKASDIVDLVLELQKHKEQVDEPSVDAFEVEPQYEEQESEDMFGSRFSSVQTLLANTETLASATGGEGDDGAAYDLAEDRNFTGVDESIASAVVAEYLNGKATSFASLADLAGFIHDEYNIGLPCVTAGIADAWEADDERAIVAFIKKQVNNNI